MIVLGADTHKRSHTIAAIGAATGELLGERTIQVGRAGFSALLAWARGLDGGRFWALEDCRHVSGAFERFLIERGERVLRISTNLMAETRKSSRAPGKSDGIDAVNVARAALREGPSSRFPPRSSTAPSSICGCWSITASASSVTASSSTTRCSGICTTSDPNRNSPAAHCFRRSAAPGSRDASPAPSRRCASGSRATSCAACATSPTPSRDSSATSPSSSDGSRRSCSPSPSSARSSRPSSSARSPALSASPPRPSSPAPPASRPSPPARATPAANAWTVAAIGARVRAAKLERDEVVNLAVGAVEAPRHPIRPVAGRDGRRRDLSR